MNTNTEKDMKPKAEANLKELEKNESSEDLDEDSEIEDSHSDFELNEHIDCCDSVNKWLDAEIIAVYYLFLRINHLFYSKLRNNEIRVHFSGWSNKYDDWIDKSSGRAQKQCILKLT